MAGKGNPKGSNAGGGMRRGQVTKKVQERAKIAAYERAANIAAPKARKRQKLPEPPPNTPRLKLGKEILEEAANYFFGLAAQYQPSGATPDIKKFEVYLEKAADIAAKVAPYQSPRLSNVAVQQQPMDLTKLTDAELAKFEQLYLKASQPAGDTGGTSAAVH